MQAPKNLKEAILQGMLVGPFHQLVDQTEKSVSDYIDKRLELALSFCQNKEQETIARNIMEFIKSESK